LYTPDHEYSFNGKGKLVDNIGAIIACNRKIDRCIFYQLTVGKGKHSLPGYIRLSESEHYSISCA